MAHARVDMRPVATIERDDPRMNLEPVRKKQRCERDRVVVAVASPSFERVPERRKLVVPWRIVLKPYVVNDEVPRVGECLPCSR